MGQGVVYNFCLPKSFWTKSDLGLKDFILSLNENLKTNISKKFNMIVKNILSCPDTKQCDSVSQGVEYKFCLPKTAWLRLKKG